LYERAQYFKNKFIRNGIFGVAASSILIYNAVVRNSAFTPGLIVFPVAAFVWLCAGLWINRKLKDKSAITISDEITDERISFKQMELILTLLFITVIFLGGIHWKYATYLLIPFLIAYLYWLFSQVKLLYTYFKA
jgi:hypothetical protein